MKRRYTIHLDKAERTPQGFLRVPARLTRVGVLKYRTKDGNILRELRHPDDVFNDESMASLARLPFTNDHPREGLLDSKNVKKHIVGWIGDTVQREGIFLKSDITLVDDDTIADVEAGKIEVSCGYTADLIEESGVFNGEPYDVRQTNIRYNHASVVKKGRAGEQVRLLLDSDEAELIEDGDEEPTKEWNMKVKIGDKEYECSQELADAFGKMQEEMKKKCDQAESDLADAKKATEVAQAKADSAEAELKEVKTKLDAAPAKDEEFKKSVAARVALEKSAGEIVKDAKFDSMTDIEIKKAVVLAKFPNTNLDGKSDVYIEARYDHALEVIKQDADAQEELKNKNKTRKDGGGDVKLDSAERRKAMIEESKNAWKTPSEFSKK